MHGLLFQHYTSNLQTNNQEKLANIQIFQEIIKNKLMYFNITVSITIIKISVLHYNYTLTEFLYINMKYFKSY